MINPTKFNNFHASFRHLVQSLLLIYFFWRITLWARPFLWWVAWPALAQSMLHGLADKSVDQQGPCSWNFHKTSASAIIISFFISTLQRRERRYMGDGERGDDFSPTPFLGQQCFSHHSCAAQCFYSARLSKYNSWLCFKSIKRKTPHQNINKNLTICKQQTKLNKKENIISKLDKNNKRKLKSLFQPPQYKASVIQTRCTIIFYYFHHLRRMRVMFSSNCLAVCEQDIKKLWTDWDKIWTGRVCDKDELIQYWWRSGY